MKRSLHTRVATLVAAAATLVALPLAAQAPAAAQAQDPGRKVVAVINGETITRAKLDQLWERAGTQMRSQYEKNGGKGAFLENYIGKRLMIQEALKTNFDKRPEVVAEVDAARESVAGVNIDEELTNMLSYQHAFAAAGRLVSAIDEMLDVLINRTGRVGL